MLAIIQYLYGVLYVILYDDDETEHFFKVFNNELHSGILFI